MPLSFAPMKDCLRGIAGAFMTSDPSRALRVEFATFLIRQTDPNSRYLHPYYDDHANMADNLGIEYFAWQNTIGALLESMHHEDSALTWTTRDLREVFDILRVDPGPNFNGPVVDAPVVDQTVVGVAQPMGEPVSDDMQMQRLRAVILELKTHVDRVLGSYKDAHNYLRNKHNALETTVDALKEEFEKKLNALKNKPSGGVYTLLTQHSELKLRVDHVEVRGTGLLNRMGRVERRVEGHREDVANKQNADLLKVYKKMDEMQMCIDNQANLITELQKKVMPPASRKIQNGPAYLGRHPAVTRPANPPVGGILKPKRKKATASFSEGGIRPKRTKRTATKRTTRKAPVDVLSKGWKITAVEYPGGRVDYEYTSPSGGKFRSLKQAKASAARVVALRAARVD